MSRLGAERLAALKGELAAGRTLRLMVVTGSMLPLLPIGESIEVAPVVRPLRPFDIVVFLSGERLICHYVVHSNRLQPAGAVVVTRGLSNPFEDLPVERRDVLGRVVSHRIPRRTRFLLIAARLLRRIRFRGET
ncbi:MAG: S24/S26 family peptidase [Elusimicrobiota bacterium]